VRKRASFGTSRRQENDVELARRLSDALSVARDVRGAGDSESRTVQPVSTIHGDTATPSEYAAANFGAPFS
jgi:hypothetical protein